MTPIIKKILLGIIAGALFTFIITSIIQYKSDPRNGERGQTLYAESRARQSVRNLHYLQNNDNEKDGEISQDKMTTLGFQHLSFLSELTRDPKLDISVFIIGRNGKFGRSFKELFRLTDTEVNDIENRIKMLREEFGATALNKAEISEAPGRMEIKIHPMEEGPEFYDRFMDTMKSTLGTDRFPAFVQLADKQAMRLFDGFGSEYRTITLAFSGEDMTNGAINVTEHVTSGEGYVSEWYTLRNHEEFLDRYAGFEKRLLKH
jgi:hypothetical protein